MHEALLHGTSQTDLWRVCCEWPAIDWTVE